MKNLAIVTLFLAVGFGASAQSTAEKIKQIIDELEFKNEVEDDAVETIYLVLNKQISNSIGVEKAIWNSIMAEFLENYWSDNRGYILLRTPIAGEKNTDFTSWDIQTLENEICYHYQQSLVEKQLLRNTAIDPFKILMDTMLSVEYRPTLYDFLAFRALDYFAVDYFDFVRFSDFDNQNIALLQDNTTFLAYSPINPNPQDVAYIAFKLFQEITAFHNKTSLPYVDVTLRRLANYFAESKSEEREKKYLHTLLALETQFSQQAGYEDILYAIGSFFQTRALQYDKIEHPEYQFDYKTAIEWYQKAIAFAPNSLAAKNATAQRKSIEDKKLSINLEDGVSLLPDQQNLMKCTYSNCDSLYFNLIQLTEEEYQNLRQKGSNTIRKTLIDSKIMQEWQLATIQFGDFREQTGYTLLPALPVGRYAVMVAPTPFAQISTEDLVSTYPYVFLHISNFEVTYRKIDIGIELMVNDRKTGTPLENAKIGYGFSNSNTAITTNELISTNKEGKAILKIKDEQKDRYLKIKVLGDNETYICDEIIYLYPESRESRSQESTYIFSDRAIYRPGQTVYFKGIAVETYHNKNQLVQNKPFNVSLKNYDNEIGSAIVLTNDFGSFEGSFLIPMTIKTGLYTISCVDRGYKTISIEEYKRPQFEVVIDKPDAAYKLDEEAFVKGKAIAYSGYPIDGATVRYRVTRNYFLPCYWRPNYSNEFEIKTDTCVSKEDGTFDFSFKALSNPFDLRYHPLYQYVIDVDVTDINGETHSSQSFLLIGTESMILSLEIPEIISTDLPANSFKISALNLSLKPQTAKISYEIVALETPKGYLFALNSREITVPLTELQTLKKALPFYDFEAIGDKSKWKELSVISSGVIQYPNDSLFIIPQLSKLKEGYYKILLTSNDAYNKEVTLEKTVFIVDSKSKKSNAYEPLFLTIDKTTAQPEDQILISVGSYLKKANVIVEIFLNDSLKSSQWISFTQNKTNIIYKIPKNSYGTLKVHTFVIQNNNYSQKTCQILIPNHNNLIEAEWLSFRDKTLPGSQETWTLKLKSKTPGVLAAEMLATMYDASLDAFKSNQFAFTLPSLFQNKQYKNISFQQTDGWWGRSGYLQSNIRYGYPKNRTYYELQTSLFDDSYPRREMVMLNAVSDLVTPSDLDYSSDNLVFESTQTALQPVRVDGIILKKSPILDHSSSQPTIRSNFNETAFFYPQLLSDDDGNIEFSFTMPDALTKWKFLGLAHTKDLKIGIFEKLIQTQKPLMIVPNLPRFFRENDSLTISAKVVNMSEEYLQGEVMLELTNTLTGMPLNIILDKPIATFKAKKGESAEVGFEIAIPYQLEAVTCKMLASVETANPDNPDIKINFSDGEEKVIPVLSNRMLVTETLPIFANANQKKNFTFTKLKNNHSTSLQHFNYTLEFTSNPLWYAVMALPYLMTYSYDCNEQIFSKLYANSIASTLANSSPKIKEVFDIWKNSTPSTLCSNLEKNEELKNILLAETPWINQAQSESEQRQQIAELFDQKRVASECALRAFQLKENQNADGGWSWFKGGLSSPYITQYIIAGFGHLQTLKIPTTLDKNTLLNAIRYVDAEQLKIYKTQKSQNDKFLENSYFNHDIIQYLYAKSLHIGAVKDNTETAEMLDIYTQHLKKVWGKQSYYMQGMIALTLWRSGEQTTAKKIVESLKAHAQYSEELGMFWKKEGYGCYWQDAQIERQALLIEAFLLITEDQKLVEKMQQWLLKQKQTQNWTTTKATAESCYALLLNNTTQLETITAMTVSVGNQIFDLTQQEQAEAGTGYFKTAWAGSAVNNQFADIKIDKPSKGIAWGAAYWQYFENMDKITSANSNLFITKKLYVVGHQDHRETLIPITENQPIKVGDKVRVVIELSSDRDMEFLHLKDMRASAFEPVNVLSGYKRQGNLWYYESTRDAATNFFIDYLPKGKYLFEYTLIASQTGTFSNGIATLQCMYAPEFSAHSEGIKVKISKP